MLFANFITAQAISNYHGVLEQVLILTTFITMLVGTAGNSGTQSATLIIRSIAVEGLDFKHWYKVFSKELLVGLLLGLTLGLIAFIRGYLENEPSHKIAFVVGSAMIIMVIWANLVGSLLPLILTKFKFDPAVISSPFMATFIDFTGIMIYFNLAIWFYGL